MSGWFLYWLKSIYKLPTVKEQRRTEMWLPSYKKTILYITMCSIYRDFNKCSRQKRYIHLHYWQYKQEIEDVVSDLTHTCIRWPKSDSVTPTSFLLFLPVPSALSGVLFWWTCEFLSGWSSPFRTTTVNVSLVPTMAREHNYEGEKSAAIVLTFNTCNAKFCMCESARQCVWMHVWVELQVYDRAWTLWKATAWFLKYK